MFSSFSEVVNEGSCFNTALGYVRHILCYPTYIYPPKLNWNHPKVFLGHCATFFCRKIDFFARKTDFRSIFHQILIYNTHIYHNNRVYPSLSLSFWDTLSSLSIRKFELFSYGLISYVWLCFWQKLGNVFDCTFIQIFKKNVFFLCKINQLNVILIFVGYISWTSLYFILERNFSKIWSFLFFLFWIVWILHYFTEYKVTLYVLSLTITKSLLTFTKKFQSLKMEKQIVNKVHVKQL